LVARLFASLDSTPSLALLWRALATTLQHFQLSQTPAESRHVPVRQMLIAMRKIYQKNTEYSVTYAFCLLLDS